MVVVPDEQYNLILDKIFKGCQRSANNGKNLRKYVSAAKRVWESSPTRFAEYLAQLDRPALRSVVPVLVEDIMDHLPNCEYLSDFLYSVFKKGHYLSVISLAGIFKLIVRKNFEHPNFYTDVYFMINPSVCYSNYARKFFDLVDIILSSSHVPNYIIAAYVKRLGRVLLLAPWNCQLPILSIIKNVLRRHNAVHDILVNRKEPVSLETDPYDETEKNLKKCGVLESSVWELRSIQQHWYSKVSEKADFIDRPAQDSEACVTWRSSDDMFERLCEKATLRLQQKNQAHNNKGKKDDNEENGDEDEQRGLSSEDEEDALKRPKLDNNVSEVVLDRKSLVNPAYNPASSTLTEKEALKRLVFVGREDGEKNSIWCA